MYKRQQQGVAIGIFIKEPGKSGPAKVCHADLRGKRAQKYEQLFEQDVEITDWTQLSPQLPFYLFASQNVDLQAEYAGCWSSLDIFPLTTTGIKTHRDHFAVGFEEAELLNRVIDFRNLQKSNEDLSALYELKNTRDWKIEARRISLSKQTDWEKYLVEYHYRPFDFRKIFHHSDIVELPRTDVMQHLYPENLALGVGRQGLAVGSTWDIVIVTRKVIDTNVYRRGGVQVFPLYLYPTQAAAKQSNLLNVATWPPDEVHGGRAPNLNPEFVQEMAQKLGIIFTPSAAGDLQTTFGPEDIFHYIYVIFHSPTYRTRYAEFLKIDFPRVPLTAEVALFRTLCGLGKELVGLHLLESPQVNQFRTRYPIAGDNLVDKGYPKYVPPQNDHPGRININKSQYFEGISPEVWGFYIGGYQVLGKWLKDRQGRQLSYDDLTHYQQVVVALQKTIELMEKIDIAIPEWPVV